MFDLIWSLQVALLAVPLVTAIFNLSSVTRLENLRVRERKMSDLISLLIPVRDEIVNIEMCLESVLATTTDNLEVIVLDDGSVDGTDIVLSRVKDSRVRIVSGAALPSGWLGKTHACHQLAKLARGEYLLFMDCDVRPEPRAIELSVSQLQDNNLSLLSVFPEQICKSWSERLVIPIIQEFFLYAFLPFGLMRRLKLSSLAAANGQWMLWKRDDYFAIGGHQAVADQVLEDMSLAKRTKAAGLKIDVVSGRGIIFCRMYDSLKEVIAGYSKNLFAFSNFKVVPFIFFLVLIILSYLAPLIQLLNGQYSAIIPLLLAAATFLIVAYRFGRLNALTLLERFAGLALVVGIALNSVRWRYFGVGSWKGRSINT